MPNIVVEKDADVVREVAMPPPAASDVPESPLFRNLDDLRSGKRIGGEGREQMLPIALAIAGTGAVFGILYAAMMFLE